MIGKKVLKPEQTRVLTDFALIPWGVRERLATQLPPDADPIETLCSSWSAAYDAGALVGGHDKVSFPLTVPGTAPDATSGPDTRLVATIRPTDSPNPTRPWMVVYAGPDGHHELAPLDDDPLLPRDLHDFAFVPWDQVGTEVARRALPERWGFEGDDDSVLRSYLRYTYQRLIIQKKVLVDAGQGVAAFNTGLVTRTYDDIFLCFEPNQGTSPWKLADACVAGEQGWGKRLVQTFNPLPERATYFDDVSDLVFDCSRKLIVDDHHILVDRVYRLPLDFLLEQCHDRPELVRTLQGIRQFPAATTEEEREAAWEKVRAYLDADSDLYMRLRNRLDDACELAQTRTQWNYRTAIPCYYPRTDGNTLLLPLCLQSPERSDAALAVSLLKTGVYQGQTILTLRQAYVNARLVCRPESDWLRV